MGCYEKHLVFYVLSEVLAGEWLLRASTREKMATKCIDSRESGQAPAPTRLEAGSRCNGWPVKLKSMHRSAINCGVGAGGGP